MVVPSLGETRAVHPCLGGLGPITCEGTEDLPQVGPANGYGNVRTEEPSIIRTTSSTTSPPPPVARQSAQHAGRFDLACAYACTNTILGSCRLSISVSWLSVACDQMSMITCIGSTLPTRRCIALVTCWGSAMYNALSCAPWFPPCSV